MTAFAPDLLLLFFLVSTASVLLVYGLHRPYSRFRAISQEATDTALAEQLLTPQTLNFLRLVKWVGLAMLVIAIIRGSLALALSIVAVSASGPLMIPRWLRHRRRRHIVAFLPDTLLMLAGSIRAGAGLQLALQTFTQENRQHPLAREFFIMQTELRLGVGLDDALQKLNRRINSTDFDLFVTALRIARETGGNLSETLERLAESLRQKAFIEGKIRALTAQGRLQGIVVAALPVLLIAVLFQLEPEAMQHLLHTPVGWVTLAIMAGLEILGVASIRRIINIDV